MSDWVQELRVDNDGADWTPCLPAATGPVPYFSRDSFVVAQETKDVKPTLLTTSTSPLEAKVKLEDADDQITVDPSIGTANAPTTGLVKMAAEFDQIKAVPSRPSESGIPRYGCVFGQVSQLPTVLWGHFFSS